jgi:hypothetical protein
MQLKKEISVGNIVTIVMAMGTIVAILITDHVQLNNHEKRLTAVEASSLKLNDTMIELATTVRDHNTQTINIK